MGGTCRNPVAIGNAAAARTFGISRTDVRSIEIIRKVARVLWPTKTAAELASRTGMTPRAAEQWLSGRCGLSADALARLLRSDAGLEMLEGIIGDAKPAWWRAFRRTIDIADLRRAQEQQRKALERLEREFAE